MKKVGVYGIGISREYNGRDSVGSFQHKLWSQAAAAIGYLIFLNIIYIHVYRSGS